MDVSDFEARLRKEFPARKESGALGRARIRVAENAIQGENIEALIQKLKEALPKNAYLSSPMETWTGTEETGSATYYFEVSSEDLPLEGVTQIDGESLT